MAEVMTKVDLKCKKKRKRKKKDLFKEKKKHSKHEGQHMCKKYEAIMISTGMCISRGSTLGWT